MAVSQVIWRSERGKMTILDKMLGEGQHLTCLQRKRCTNMTGKNQTEQGEVSKV